MLDSNAIDSIVDDKSLYDCVVAAINDGKLTLYITHIQDDEIKDTPERKAEKRSNLQSFIKIYCTSIATRGFVIGVSTLGEAAIYDGEEIDAICNGDVKMMHDALIAATANCDADYLVTNDDKLIKRVKKELPNYKVLRNSEFNRLILESFS